MFFAFLKGKKGLVWSNRGKVWAQGLLLLQMLLRGTLAEHTIWVGESRYNTANKTPAPGHVPVLCPWGVNGAVERCVWTGGNGAVGASAVLYLLVQEALVQGLAYLLQ